MQEKSLSQVQRERQKYLIRRVHMSHAQKRKMHKGRLGGQKCPGKAVPKRTSWAHRFWGYASRLVGSAGTTRKIRP